MHNMLNQFYDYVGSQLVDFFERESIKTASNRYYLHLPSNEHVTQLYEVLKERQESKLFLYQHREGLQIYETIALTFGDMTYVIATTSFNTNIDFLVTLRNEMSEQKGKWKNTSLLFISNTLNDSIRGGSIDVTSEGFPLHVKQLIGNLDEMVQKSMISAGEKEMIRHYLKGRLSEYEIENASFLDFEDILAILHKEVMSKTDYYNLHYFPDEDLNDLIRERDSIIYGSRDWHRIQGTIEDRLKENNFQHEEIESLRSLGNAKERLIEKYDDNGGKKLQANDWHTIDFTTVKDWEEKVKATQDIAFVSEKVSVYLEGEEDDHAKLVHWQRPNALTTAGRRRWNFIVFHPNYQEGEKVQITLPFDRHTAKRFLNASSQNNAETKGYSLVVTVTLGRTGATFQRITYKHENAAKSNFTFDIAVIAWEPKLFEHQSDSYLVKTSPKSQQALQFTLDNSSLVLGEKKRGDIELTSNHQVVEVQEGATITFEPGILEEGDTSLRFNVKLGDFELPIEIKDENLKRTPISAKKLWESKRMKRSSFQIDEEMTRVEIDHIPYSTYEKNRAFFKMEFDWLAKGLRQARISYDELLPVECELPKDVEAAYDGFLEAVSKTGTIPSLLYYSEDVREKAKEYIISYIDAIELIEENQVMTAQQKSLFYLGTVHDYEKIYMTPFSPLNVVYQLELDNESKGETIDSNILQRLNAAFTLPYLMDKEGELYKPTTDSPLPEWHTYLPRKNVTVGETNLYLAKVVQEKLDQFTDHYDYLFQIDDSTPILLNVIHIPNDLEILRGILEWTKDKIKQKRSLSGLRQIELSTHSDYVDKVSAFDVFNNTSTASELKALLGLDLRVNEFLEDDILSSIQNVLHYTKRDMDASVEYAHITFYKMKSEEAIVRQIVNEMPSSLNLNGLFTTNVFKKAEYGYRVGYGIGDSEYTRTNLTYFATKMNELAVNMEKKGQNPYHKNIAFAIHSDEEDQEYLSTLYEQSNWLTFIDPVIDLKYFQNTSKNLVIVHYSDQYSPSNNYDAITITDKSDEYYYVIDEFLKSQHVNASDAQIENIIRTFNTFNGEWLLRAVQNRSHDKREKMSMVSAIKLALQFFNKPEVLWVPLSMEEVVRVTGSVKLSKKAGLFSGRTIGTTGNCSDDLLMMGLEKIEGNLYIHMYPIEVKIGANSSSVIAKGLKQVHELKRRLNEHLLDDTSFDAKFLRNFFIRLFINNSAKMHQNDIWSERNYQLESSVIDQLLNDDFQIIDSLQADFGSGLIISFSKNKSIPTRERSQGIVILDFPEQYGYTTLPIVVSELDDQLTTRRIEVGTVIEQPINNQERSISSDEIDESSIRNHRQNTVKIEPTLLSRQDDIAETEQQIASEQMEVYDKKMNVIKGTVDVFSLEKVETSEERVVRPLVGVANNMPIHWEFNHDSLSNRHLVIGGRSGQGKTYFIQALLLDLSKTKQSAVVIDYSSSYTPAQLDPVFVEKMGSKLKERIVYHEGFPLNPFLLREKEVSGITFVEKPAEAARRVVDVFASVYRTFGAQQKAALYDATKRGIEKYHHKMTMELLLEELAGLENYSNQVITSISSRLVQFVDIDPFDYEIENQWETYFSPGGNITIIQLAGYDQDEIKRLLAEFILWDLWYYTQEGTKDKSIPVILDEAQNLDFSDGSPSAKILREGRKFGWSAWFATQTFNNFTKDELSIIDNAGTKVYFNPVETEIRVIAGRIGNASPDELRMLKKGQCLVIGQFMKHDGKLGNPTYHIVKVPAIDGPERS